MECQHCMFIKYHYEYNKNIMNYLIKNRTCKLEWSMGIKGSEDVCKYPISIWLIMLIINFNKK